jgi:phosphonopyruvate decarboxylase
MVTVDHLVETAKRGGFSVWSGVPCSYLQGLINRVIGDPAIRYVAAANEGEAVALAAGTEIGGGRAVVMLQNSGLGNAVNPLTSLCHSHRIPVLLIVSRRGEPGGAPDEPQHALMGAITTDLLQLMQIPWERCPVRDDEVAGCLGRALAHMQQHRRPYALVAGRNDLSAWPAPALAPAACAAPRPVAADAVPAGHASRRAMLQAIQSALAPDDVVLATTGFTGRELYAIGDRVNQLYLVGAMGCASSVGLGLALQCPRVRVIVIDGDGAVLMRLGALAMIGRERPRNLLHIVLDNGVHESTGGQPTGSALIDLAAIAQACGYERTHTVAHPADLRAVLAERGCGLTFARIMTAAGTDRDLPRPAVGPAELAERLRQHVSLVAAGERAT